MNGGSWYVYPIVFVSICSRSAETANAGALSHCARILSVTRYRTFPIASGRQDLADGRIQVRTKADVIARVSSLTTSSKIVANVATGMP